MAAVAIGVCWGAESYVWCCIAVDMQGIVSIGVSAASGGRDFEECPACMTFCRVTSVAPCTYTLDMSALLPDWHADLAQTVHVYAVQLNKTHIVHTIHHIIMSTHKPDVSKAVYANQALATWACWQCSLHGLAAPPCIMARGKSRWKLNGRVPEVDKTGSGLLCM